MLKKDKWYIIFGLIKKGPCHRLTIRFYYNVFTRDCLLFVYGGCGGNRNNFQTLEECRRFCAPSMFTNFKVYTVFSWQLHFKLICRFHDGIVSPPSNKDKWYVIFGQIKKGPCHRLTIRFYYNVFTRDCLLFVYGGCGGNRNNFQTLEECRRFCAPSMFTNFKVYTVFSWQLHFKLICRFHDGIVSPPSNVALS
ncbi:boophilin-H2-like [Centruroides sculpturatus]|uniref:boophilin-H2-like n=1 Tax=Centruroides sculpturatus TaxID=218467 RepID=UPI000C6E7E29|nr:boophilin-H2-like [Centruroides sculpturatus]